jgi:hypothetical protein
MEMVDVIKKLKEITNQSPEVAKAIQSLTATNPTQTSGNLVSQEQNALSTAKEGGMSDVNIGAQEAVGEYTNEDGNLDRPKADVLQDMEQRKAKLPFPQSFEIEEAMKMVVAEFEDDGSKREIYEPEPDEIMKQDAPATLDAPVVTKTVLNTEQMTNESKKPLKEAITMSADSPEEAGMLMQIMKLAGVQQVTPDMVGAEEPSAEVPADNDADAEVNPEHGEEGHDHSDCPVCGDDAVRSNDMGKMRDMISQNDGDEQADETWDNEPDEKVSDIDTLVNVHSGGLNKQKQQVRKEYPGDNPLAVKEEPTEEHLSNSLRNQYESFKKSYQEAAKVTEKKAKPDFLDMDKDGDKKEPMKKAIQDKK